MSDQQVALQEVDEAVRRDELNDWWKRWGTWVVAASVLIVVAAAGTVGWRKYDATQRAEAGAVYSATLAKAANDPAGARADFEKQARDAREPYRSLAKLMVAELADTPEKQAEALSAVGPTLSSTELSDLAAVMAAMRSVDAGKADDMIAKLEPLAAEGRPFRTSVRELQAASAARKGDLKRARELWTAIANDAEAPQGAKQRAGALLNLNEGTDAK